MHSTLATRSAGETRVLKIPAIPHMARRRDYGAPSLEAQGKGGIIAGGTWADGGADGVHPNPARRIRQPFASDAVKVRPRDKIQPPGAALRARWLTRSFCSHTLFRLHRVNGARGGFQAQMARATSSRCAGDTSRPANTRPKSIAVPAPREVMILPSTTTRSSASRSGNSAATDG